jgi:hypothetical protein
MSLVLEGLDYYKQLLIIGLIVLFNEVHLPTKESD